MGRTTLTQVKDVHLDPQLTRTTCSDLSLNCLSLRTERGPRFTLLFFLREFVR